MRAPHAFDLHPPQNGHVLWRRSEITGNGRRSGFNCTCGLVAMTSASHAECRQFDPGQVYPQINQASYPPLFLMQTRPKEDTPKKCFRQRVPSVLSTMQTKPFVILERHQVVQNWARSFWDSALKRQWHFGGAVKVSACKADGVLTANRYRLG